MDGTRDTTDRTTDATTLLEDPVTVLHRYHDEADTGHHAVYALSLPARVHCYPTEGLRESAESTWRAARIGFARITCPHAPTPQPATS